MHFSRLQDERRYGIARRTGQADILANRWYQDGREADVNDGPDLLGWICRLNHEVFDKKHDSA